MRDKVYDFIVEFISNKGYSPSYREIAKGVGLKSTASVLHHLDSLAAEGRIGFVSHTPRSIHLKKTDRSNA